MPIRGLSSSCSLITDYLGFNSEDQSFPNVAAASQKNAFICFGERMQLLVSLKVVLST